MTSAQIEISDGNVIPDFAAISTRGSATYVALQRSAVQTLLLFCPVGFGSCPGEQFLTTLIADSFERLLAQRLDPIAIVPGGALP